MEDDRAHIPHVPTRLVVTEGGVLPQCPTCNKALSGIRAEFPLSYPNTRRRLPERTTYSCEPCGHNVDEVEFRA